MKADAMIPLAVSKEIRAIAPIWLASGLTIGAARLLPIAHENVRALQMLAYALGVIAVGAGAVGHEYTHRTLSLMLSQPRQRRTAFIAKLLVAALMNLVLMAFAWAAMSRGGHFDAPRELEPWQVLVLPMICGLFLAPWLSMVGRSPLAGMVLTFAVPGCAVTVGELWNALDVGGRDLTLSDELGVVPLLCAVGGFLGWRAFMRLETTGSDAAAIQLPASLNAPAGPRRRHPLLLLASKELHLQHMTFVVVLLFAFAWTTVSLLRRAEPRFDAFPLEALTILYLMLLPVLIGSLASAEERQLGTLEWQMLLPVPTWQQWSVKVGVAFGLALTLAVILPSALGYSWRTNDPHGADTITMATAVILLASVSLYVSSVASSGVRAVVAAFPAVLATVLFIQLVDGLVSLVPVRRPIVRLSHWVPGIIGPAVALGLFVALLLAFASINHRFEERKISRTFRQVAWIGGFLVCVVLLITSGLIG